MIIIIIIMLMMIAIRKHEYVNWDVKRGKRNREGLGKLQFNFRQIQN